MPHVKFTYNNIELPSVNEVTGSLSKQGLINWWRKLGFKAADKITQESADKGRDIASVFEAYRKRELDINSISIQYKPFVQSYQEWVDKVGSVKQLAVEPHLVSLKHGYHGSPDLIFSLDDEVEVGDDKAKGRPPDYKLFMNEAAYANCELIEVNGELTPVPWKVPIRFFRFFSYHPDTGQLLEAKREKYKPDLFGDFLVCKQMFDVNQKAEKYFKENCGKYT
jgi:hypothetical protein